MEGDEDVEEREGSKFVKGTLWVFYGRGYVWGHKARGLEGRVHQAGAVREDSFFYSDRNSTRDTNMT